MKVFIACLSGLSLTGSFVFFGLGIWPIGLWLLVLGALSFYRVLFCDTAPYPSKPDKLNLAALNEAPYEPGAMRDEQKIVAADCAAAINKQNEYKDEMVRKWRANSPN